jgi:primosomal protein N' (replication factor Y)
VVATPGIEPVVEGGYSAVVLLDCQDALSRDSLKASETAVRQWANAISLLSPQGRAVAVGIVGDLAQMFALWQLVEIAELELQERTALRFSPAVRMLSAQSSQANLQKVRERLSEEPRVEIIGQVPETAEEWKLLARFPYSAGPDVSKLIRSIALELSGGQKRYSAKSGRAMRPVTFKLDDPQVL